MGKATTPGVEPGVVVYGAPTYIDARPERVTSISMKDKHQLNEMFGVARFETYLVASEDDPEKAAQLYRWNTHLAGAFIPLLSHFEVLTRNAIDRVLRDWNYAECGYTEWALEHQSADLLYEMLSRPMSQARGWARKESGRRRFGHARRGAPPTHDDIVAQLTLGNWSNLFGEALPVHRRNAMTLWEECLHKAFPYADKDDSTRRSIGKKFESLTRLRNRISHQENLLDAKVNRRLHDVLSVLAAIDPSFPSWVMFDSQIRKVAKSDPRRTWSL